MMLSPRPLLSAAANAAHLARYGHLADLRPMPTVPVGGGAAGEGAAVRRYRTARGLVPAGPPVLFVPPLAAPARCYDLRRGCSLAEHVVGRGRRSYLLDPGAAGKGAREQGIREWIGEVLPAAVRAVSRDAGGQPVQLVGWCLGGLFALLAAADAPRLPIASIAVIGTPADARGVRLTGSGLAPRRPAHGAESDVLALMFGGLSRPLLGRASTLAGFDKYVLRPSTLLAHLHNADFLAQIEALDHFANALLEYPACAAREIYRLLSRSTEPAGGGMELGDRRIDLGRVRVPVLAIAGRGDAIAPARAVRPLTRLLSGAPEVRVALAEGDHLGVLTGRSAKAGTWAHLDRWLDEGTVRHGIRPHRRESAVSV
ncbi:alpha/beta fold hydrolase [Spirillospora albida]|uniref:alpha/beta fold hydrolase n=1 Tax=Spirillospora albida TaxID=58123 RepID=UPI0004BE69B8|nr:alpha/beta fold hydrolase [Spirillospora albida]